MAVAGAGHDGWDASICTTEAETKSPACSRSTVDPRVRLTQVAVQALSSASGISRADVSRAPIGALTRFVSAVACAPVVTSVVDPLRVPP